ncbi:MAG TPA: hypothetical protein VKP69_00450 [Isosphaeraceae bacterium]|nr:hypothetical protein [Isosphaeraceae bacterium]
MGTPVPANRRSRDRARPLLIAALALGAPIGCGREFYREWANQDAAEAVFEKSRDPRWRLDRFSIDPPALSRFADPYDPDTPPAPPDDYATQALSPVPQWPDHRLITPVEGTGYLDMLDAWQRHRPDREPSPGAPNPPSIFTNPLAPAPPAPPPGSPSPFAPDPNPGAPSSAPNSGPRPDETPPRSNFEPRPNRTTPDLVPSPPAPRPTRPEMTPPRARAARRDLGIRLAAFQDTGLPLPVPPPAVPGSRPRRATPPGPTRDLATPPVGLDPNPAINSDLSAPVNPRPDLSPEQYRASEAMASEVAGILVPGAIEFDEAEAAGLPKDSRPYVITLEQAFLLSLINARVYQFNLESIYLASLAVTLQRFAFQPQFYAGLSPLTGVGLGGGPSPGGGFPTANPINQFLYRTRETGAPASTLSIGTVAGFGKVLNSGARLVAGFANQVVFNFIGKNSIQPVVNSSLPLSLVQPFLRGGGRAVTLEALTQAERNLVYQVRAFAKFRQEFIVAALVGGAIPTLGTNVVTQGFSGGGNTDPVVGFINVLQDLQTVENDRKNIAAFEQLVKVYRELIEGESSGLSQLQLDQVESSLVGARQQIVLDRTAYRNDLDGFKMQMGLPPDTPLILDRGLTRRFKQVFDAIDEWQRDPRRDLSDLPKFAARLPDLEDIVIDGRSALAVYPKPQLEGSIPAADEDKLEDLLLAAERVALEHRLDLMNARAQLYDTWRTIRVTANALRGVLNIALTNEFVTPPATTNPFAFVEQAKQFSLVLNAELPLVRLAERNNLRTALINYQRQRRALQSAEDFLKLQLRTDIRNLHQQYLNYEYARRNFVLSIRQKDQAFEQIIAPPQQAAGGAANLQQSNQAAIQTTNLINFQGRLLGFENQLVSAWQLYQLQRLQVYRDLGTLPYDEWEAFRELFPSEYTGGAGGVAARSVAGPARAEAPRAPEVVRH